MVRPYASSLAMCENQAINPARETTWVPGANWPLTTTRPAIGPAQTGPCASSRGATGGSAPAKCVAFHRKEQSEGTPGITGENSRAPKGRPDFARLHGRPCGAWGTSRNGSGGFPTSHGGLRRASPAKCHAFFRNAPFGRPRLLAVAPAGQQRTGVNDLRKRLLA